MHGQPVKGLLLGCALGLVLWVVAGLAVFSEVGYLPHTRIYLWCLLGVLIAFVGVDLVRTLLRGDLRTPCPPGTPSPS